MMIHQDSPRARETRRRAPIVAMPRAAGSPRRHESGRLIQRSRLQGTKARDAAGEDASTLHLVLVFLKLAERVLDVLQRDDPADEGRHGLSKQARSTVPRAQGPSHRPL